jgi:hypothetical protein
MNRWWEALYSPDYLEVEFCELRLYGVLGSSPNRLCEVRAIRLDSQRVLRIGRHSVPFRGSAIVPTILSFLSRAPEKVPIRIYEGIPQVDCLLALSCSSRTCGDECPMNSTKQLHGFPPSAWKELSENSGFRSRHSPGRVPPDRTGALIHPLGSLCTTTTCRPRSRGVGGLRRYSCASGRVIYAGSCK